MSFAGAAGPAPPTQQAPEVTPDISQHPEPFLGLFNVRGKAGMFLQDTHRQNTLFAAPAGAQLPLKTNRFEVSEALEAF